MSDALDTLPDRGKNERTKLYYIAPEYRPEPRVLQWRWIRLQLKPTDPTQQ